MPWGIWDMRNNSLLTITQRLAYDQTMNKKTLSEVMRYLGSRKSKAKAAASRENGKLGGRPRKHKESK
jgi:hypothetical protein